MCPVITDNIPQPMTDFYGGLTQYAVDQNAPCTCGASGGASGGLVSGKPYLNVLPLEKG